MLFVELRNEPLIPIILPLIFSAAKFLDKESFKNYVFPQVSSLLLTEEPFQVPLIFLQNLEFMISSTDQSVIQNCMKHFNFLLFQFA